MTNLNPPPPGPDEPPPPYVESEGQSPAPPASTSAPAPAPAPASSASSLHSQTPAQGQARPSASPRPPQGPPDINYPLHIRPNSLRSEYAFPRDWAPARHVSMQDWSNFISYLLPDDAVNMDAKALSPDRRRNIESIIREWNDTYFLPRGVKIYVDYEGTSQNGAHRPGTNSWDTSSFASMPSTTASAGPSRPSPTSTYSRPESSRERLKNKFKGKAKERDVNVSSEAISVGDKFHLSAGGLKIGRFNLDERGMNYGGKQIGPQIPAGGLQSRPGAPVAGGYTPQQPRPQPSWNAYPAYQRPGANAMQGDRPFPPNMAPGPAQLPYGPGGRMYGQPPPGGYQQHQPQPQDGPPPGEPKGYHTQQESGTM